jgi:hypothetical protein
MGDKDGGADGGEIPAPARPVRMSLTQVKAGKLQKKQRLAQARSADAMNTSRDFFFSADRSSSASGGGRPTGRPIRRSVSFSDETSVCRTVAGKTCSASQKAAAAPPSTVGEPVFNSRGEMQADSDDSDDDTYEDGETQAVLSASNSLVSRNAILPGFDGHPATASIPQGSPDSMATSTSSLSSLESVKDVEAAEEVGLIQADWMEVADSRYTRRSDFERLEVRLDPTQAVHDTRLLP